MDIERVDQSQSLVDLLQRRNQRLQTILKILLVVGVLGILSTLPSFQGDVEGAEMGVISLVSLSSLWLVYLGCYVMTRKGRHHIARNMLFACWLVYAFVQAQLYSPTLSDPMLGLLFMSISQVFYVVVLIGIVTLDLWHRACVWLGVLVVSYLAAFGVVLVRHVEDMAFIRFYVITVSVCLMLQLCIMAFARAFTSDLNQLLDQSEGARQTEMELRQQTEVARDNAMQASLVKSQFLTNMSHELRTPLSAIIGYVELIREESEDLGVNDFDGDLGQIKNAATHLHGLINDILDLSKIEAGKLEIIISSVSLLPMLKSVEATVHPLMEKSRNTFTLSCDTHIETFECDEVRCKQVLLNLLSNAGKFTSHGEVNVSVMDATLSDGSAGLRIDVQDSGIGIAGDKLEKIFAPFEQADGSTTREYGGTGLGLPISVRLVEMMGGELSVDSSPGKGSTFRVILPVRAES